MTTTAPPPAASTATGQADGTVTPGPAAPPGSGRRLRGIALWAVGVVVGGFLIALAAGSSAPQDYLHPDGTGEGGTRALVEVLRDHGVDVEVVGTADDAVAGSAAGAGVTVVVGNSGLLTSTAARRLLAATRGVDHLVFLDGARSVLPDLDLGVALAPTDAEPGGARCDSPWVHGGDEVSHLSYAVVPTGDALPSRAVGCYPLGGNDRGDDGGPEPAALTTDGAQGWGAVDLPATTEHAPVTVVGFPDAATNRFVTDVDNAGLVVRLLGASPRLVWYHPTAEDLAANPGAPDERSVWPEWTRPALVVLGLAFVAFALARGRRLGRLVPEALPVVVRATETTESRAELYRSAGDRARAATILRRATARRLAVRLGIPPGAPLDALVPAVADAADLPVAQVDAVLRDTPPSDEAALVAVAQQLAHLEEKVRST